MIKKYKWLIDAIKKFEKITIFTHINPDGDTIGSAIALKEIIKLNFKNKLVQISSDDYPINLKWLGKNKKVTNQFLKDSLGIMVDTPNFDRVFDKRVKDLSHIIKIDHHPDSQYNWLVSIVDENAPANAQILVSLIRELNLKYNLKILNSLFVAIWTDTSGLVERNANNKKTQETVNWLLEKGVNSNRIIKKLKHKIKTQNKIRKIATNYEYKLDNKLALNINDFVVSNDLYRDIVDLFNKESKSSIAIFVSKMENGDYRVGYRSKKYDVSKIAKKFNGGGHKSSSGSTISSLNNFVTKVTHLVKVTYKF